jgi:hypothetical protein
MAAPNNTLEMEKDMDGSLNVQTRSTQELEQLHSSRQLPGRLERIDRLQVELEQTVTLLEQALSPVLDPQLSGSVRELDPAEDPRTELASWLDSTAQRMQQHLEYVRQLVNRVDL